MRVSVSVSVSICACARVCLSASLSLSVCLCVLSVTPFRACAAALDFGDEGKGVSARSVLGYGSGGVVYKATYQGRQVAVKVIHAGLVNPDHDMGGPFTSPAAVLQV